MRGGELEGPKRGSKAEEERGRGRSSSRGDSGFMRRKERGTDARRSKSRSSRSEQRRGRGEQLGRLRRAGAHVAGQLAVVSADGEARGEQAKHEEGLRGRLVLDVCKGGERGEGQGAGLSERRCDARSRCARAACAGGAGGFGVCRRSPVERGEELMLIKSCCC